MAKQYLVTLTSQEREVLLALTKRGKVAARKLTRAHLLWQADAGATDEAIAQALHADMATVERVRKRFVEQGLEAALTERPRPGGKRRLDGRTAAVLGALACSIPPDERKCWTMQLLADNLVDLTDLDKVSAETVRRALKQMRFNRG